MTIWNEIQLKIRSNGFDSFAIQSYQVVSGGDINQAFCVLGDDSSFFVKINAVECLDMFEQEKKGLELMSTADSFIIPQPLAVGTFDCQSFLIMENMAISQTGDMAKFAQSLASMHQITRAEFGLDSDNYIGTNRQLNRWCSHWGDFFCEQRLKPQIQMLIEKNISQNFRRKLNDLINELPSFLVQHQPVPVLVHGDLWQGNYGFNSRNQPTIYDPACYFGDREVDLAMLKLFGNPGSDFDNAYQKVIENSDGYEIRQYVYNLYHLLNHANLFGGSYLSQSNQCVLNILESL